MNNQTNLKQSWFSLRLAQLLLVLWVITMLPAAKLSGGLDLPDIILACTALATVTINFAARWLIWLNVKDEYRRKK